MAWEFVQFKYELMRISDILKNWAIFKASETLLSEISEIFDSLRVESYNQLELDEIKEKMIYIIWETGDSKLINDLSKFIEQTSLSKDNDKGVVSP